MPKDLTPLQQGRLEALKHMTGIVSMLRARKNLPAYDAALDDMMIHVDASIERVENGGEVYSTAIVQDHA